MNHASSFPAALVGTWVVDSDNPREKDEMMHLGSDGRMVHFVHFNQAGTRLRPLWFWTESTGGDQYRIWPGWKNKGWEIALIPTATGVTVLRAGKEWKLVAVAESAIPEWYPERLARVLARMDAEEAAANDLKS